MQCKIKTERSRLNGKPELSVVLANSILKTMSLNPFLKISIPFLLFFIFVGGGGVTIDNTHGTCKLTLLQEDSSVIISNKATRLMVFIFLVSTGSIACGWRYLSQVGWELFCPSPPHHIEKTTKEHGSVIVYKACEFTSEKITVFINMLREVKLRKCNDALPAKLLLLLHDCLRRYCVFKLEH